jgi:hypothetical protein
MGVSMKAVRTEDAVSSDTSPEAAIDDTRARRRRGPRQPHRCDALWSVRVWLLSAPLDHPNNEEHAKHQARQRLNVSQWAYLTLMAPKYNTSSKKRPVAVV